MRIFSESLNAFRMKQQKRLKEIVGELRQAKIELEYVRHTLAWYGPPKLYIGQHKKNNLGAYWTDTNTITLSPTLVTYKQAVIDEIIKHELAHWIQRKHFGNSVKTHGKEFREICRAIGTDGAAKTDIQKENAEAKASIKEEGLLAKVEKLLKLGESANENEAEAAISKANELIEKYNLQYVGKDTDELFQKTVYMGKQKTSIVSSVSYLCKELFEVHPVWGTFGGGASLEFNGSEEKVEVASYVFDFVIHEVERFYKKARKEHGLSGRTAKINYIEGLIMAFVDNVKKANKKSEAEMTEEEREFSKAMVKSREEEYNKINATIYENRLVSTLRRRRYDENARNAGKSDSSKFSINKGVGGSSNGGGQKLLA